MLIFNELFKIIRSLKILLFIGILFTLPCNLFSQTDNDKSLIQYLGQTKTYITFKFQNCQNEMINNSLVVSCSSKEFIIGFRDGISFSITYSKPSHMFNFKNVGSEHIKEMNKFEKEGWKIIAQIKDENGVYIKYTLMKHNQCIWYFYTPSLGWLSYQVCD